MPPVSIPKFNEEKIKRKTVNKISFYDTKQTIVEEVQSVKTEENRRKKQEEKLVVDMSPVEFDNKAYEVEQTMFDTSKELRG